MSESETEKDRTDRSKSIQRVSFKCNQNLFLGAEKRSNFLYHLQDRLYVRGERIMTVIVLKISISKTGGIGESCKSLPACRS